MPWNRETLKSLRGYCDRVLLKIWHSGQNVKIFTKDRAHGVMQGTN